MTKLEKQLKACNKKFVRDLSKAIKVWVAEEVKKLKKK